MHDVEEVCMKRNKSLCRNRDPNYVRHAFMMQKQHSAPFTHTPTHMHTHARHNNDYGTGVWTFSTDRQYESHFKSSCKIDLVLTYGWAFDVASCSKAYVKLRPSN